MDVTRRSTLLATGSALGLAGCVDGITGGTPTEDDDGHDDDPDDVVSHVGIENGEVVGRAEAIDTSDDDGGCGEAETHPSAFVRVSSDDVAIEHRPGEGFE